MEKWPSPIFFTSSNSRLKRPSFSSSSAALSRSSPPPPRTGSGGELERRGRAMALGVQGSSSLGNRSKCGPSNETVRERPPDLREATEPQDSNLRGDGSPSMSLSISSQVFWRESWAMSLNLTLGLRARVKEPARETDGSGGGEADTLASRFRSGGPGLRGTTQRGVSSSPQPNGGDAAAAACAAAATCAAARAASTCAVAGVGGPVCELAGLQICAGRFAMGAAAIGTPTTTTSPPCA
mmetsp:Transcript_43591/g.114999  ORF Transcript_43591/g.114999 Transcript_43591/m.114999 type:complete len:239 (+) Transcript_43591:1283-1999(+)